MSYSSQKPKKLLAYSVPLSEAGGKSRSVAGTGTGTGTAVATDDGFGGAFSAWGDGDDMEMVTDIDDGDVDEEVC